MRNEVLTWRKILTKNVNIVSSRVLTYWQSKCIYTANFIQKDNSKHFTLKALRNAE